MDAARSRHNDYTALHKPMRSGKPMRSSVRALHKNSPLALLLTRTCHLPSSSSSSRIAGGESDCACRCFPPRSGWGV
eukprot:2713602-Pleurochrysis_carterae.AAC.7